MPKLNLCSSANCVYQINMPCHTYVKKYVLSRYLENKWTPIKTDRLGKYFVALLERSPKVPHGYRPMQDELEIKILNDYAARRGFYLTQESMDDFNEYIRLEIIENICMYLHNIKNRVGIKKYDRVWTRVSREDKPIIVELGTLTVDQLFEKKEAIYDYLAKFSITEDDMSFEMIQKATQRFKLPMLSN